MVWRPEDDSQSTWTPPTAEQIEEMRRNRIEPRLEIVPATPTRQINEIGRRPSMPEQRRERVPQQPTRIVYH